MYLSCAVYTANHLHIVVDVAEWLGDDHRPLTLVAELLRCVQADAGRGGLVEDEHVKLTIVELALHPLFVFVCPAFHHYTAFTVTLHVQVASGQLTDLIPHIVQPFNNGIKWTDENVAGALPDEVL